MCYTLEENGGNDMGNNTIVITPTTEDDLQNICDLWNNGEVMKTVGFPRGTGDTLEGIKKWNERTKERRPLSTHYSIYCDTLGYCGESGYQIHTDTKIASLDIKLLPEARGKGIAYEALSFVIGEAFANGAIKVWVDPHPSNEKALLLYQKLGFQRKEMPEFVKLLEQVDEMNYVPVYMEIELENWDK